MKSPGRSGGRWRPVKPESPPSGSARPRAGPAGTGVGLSKPPLTPAAWLRYDSIQRGLAAARPCRVLEVGAGQGAMGCRLARRFEYVGLEPDARSLIVATGRMYGLPRGQLLACTTEELDGHEAFDLVCAFEVLEHLSDDGGELTRWWDLLHPGGHVLVSVPAHRHRFGPADQVVGHYRRYDRADLEITLSHAGFDTLWIDAWGAGLGHALEWVRNRVASRYAPSSASEGSGRSGRWLQPRTRVAGLLTATLALPFRALQRPMRGTTLGIGWVALGQKPR